MRTCIVLFMLMAAMLAVATGCRPSTEAEFIAADVQVTATYAQLAHPAAIAHADTLIDAGGNDETLGRLLKANLGALLIELDANNQTKVRMLEADEDLAGQAARALGIAQDLLAAYLEVKPPGD